MFAFDKPFVWLIILVIFLIVFGAGKLPEIGRSLGKSIKEFKDETQNGLTDTVPSSKVVTDTKSFDTIATNSSVASSEPSIRRRIIKYPDGREEVIEEHVTQK